MRRLLGAVFDHLAENKHVDGVSAEFLAALTANESGGDPHATRFEAGVYQHLKSVAEGRASSYGTIYKSLLDKEICRYQPGGVPLATAPQAEPFPPAPPTGMTAASGTTDVVQTVGTAVKTSADAAADNHPQAEEPSAPMAGIKAESYHAEHLTAAFSTASAAALSALEDQAIRRLATSWGLTQIMGYHMLGRPEPVDKLCDPAYHYVLAARMIEDFAARFDLDPRRDFEALFRCWNTGRPDGKTYDPMYVQKGIRRIEICRQLDAMPEAPAPVITAPPPAH